MLAAAVTTASVAGPSWTWSMRLVLLALAVGLAFREFASDVKRTEYEDPAAAEAGHD